jgi:hypothetical protein
MPLAFFQEPAKRSNSAADFSRAVRSGTLSLVCAKTSEFSVLRSVCRKTDEFPVPVTAALIGRFFALPEIG